MILNESAEMYLEAIYLLSSQKQHVRSIDIAEYMNYSKPSVSRAVGLLKGSGLITVDSDGTILLTAEGQKAAGSVYEKHTVLRDALIALGVDETAATKDACKIEHVISEQSFAAIKNHLEKKKAL